MKTATQQDTFDHIFGSGATAHSWWEEEVWSFNPTTDAPDGWSVTLFTEDRDTGEEQKYTVTHATIMRAVRKMISGNTEWPRAGEPSQSAVREARNLIFKADDADLDADVADQVLQVAVFGHIIYG